MSKVAPRPRFSFSLRALLFAFLLLGIVLSWFAWQVHVVRQRQQARAWIAQRGGIVGHSAAAPGSWIRLRLEDELIDEIWMQSISPEEQQKLQAIFPEARVHPTAHPDRTGLQLR